MTPTNSFQDVQQRFRRVSGDDRARIWKLMKIGLWGDAIYEIECLVPEPAATLEGKETI